MKTFIVNNPAADPQDDLLAAAAAIREAGWWGRSDLGDERWPLTTDEAAQMLILAGEFAVDAADLADLIDRRLLPAPATGEAGLEWSAADIIAAGGLLEGRQQWRATPSGHDPKKHPCRLLLEQARAEGRVEEIVAGQPGVPRFDARHLLGLLAACDSREGRAKVIALLTAVLEADHGILI